MTNRERAANGERSTHVSRTHPSTQAGTMVADRYELLEQVGAGASAVTWRARDTRLGRIVAVKLLRPALAAEPGYAQRFEREAQLAASISHPNVVDVYDVGQEDGQLYIVMQYVDGEDLKHLIEREGRLSPDRAVALEQQILDGLGAIHRAGIIHRDIKPQNVLIGGDGIARVTDFGVAHIDAGEGLTSTGMAIGTAAYMAPEQAEGSQVTEATDIYAAGVVLYELLTGHLPFTGPSSMAIMLAHIQQPVTPPSQAAPAGGISPALDGVVLQAMAKSPGDRFRSVRAMSQALTGALPGGSPAPTQRIAAPPVSQARTTQAMPAPRPNAPPLRPPAAVTEPPLWRSFAPAALLVLVLLVLLAGAGWYLVRGNPFTTSDGGSGQLPALVDATATQRPAQTPTATVGLVEPSAPTETLPVIVPLEPTQTPEQPTATPTETPAPTDTPAPTETPVPTDTPVPTMPPTQPLIVPPTQENAGENIIVPASSSTAVIQSMRQAPAREVQATVTPADWAGGTPDKVRDEAVVLIAPGRTATLRFRLTGVSKNGAITLSLRGATSSSSGVAPSMIVMINGATVTQEDAPFPAGDGNKNHLSFGDAVFHIPAENLKDGENTLEIANVSEAADQDGTPAIAISTGTLAMQTADPDGVIEIESPQPSSAEDVKIKPTKKPKSNNGKGQGNGNKDNGKDKHGN